MTAFYVATGPQRGPHPGVFTWPAEKTFVNTAAGGLLVEKAAVELSDPQGIAVNSAGHVYVDDLRNRSGNYKQPHKCLERRAAGIDTQRPE
jgi:hypothetical protein